MDRPHIRRASPAATPSGRWTLIYDGDCNFCIASARALARLAPAGKLEMLSFREPGALERFPTVTQGMAERKVQLAAPDGRVFAGAEAAFAAMGLRPVLKPLLWLYRLPGVRHGADLVYAAIARNRFRILGRRGDACESGACRR